MSGLTVAEVSAEALDAPLSAPFEIASGAQNEVRNVLVRVTLSDGSLGFGEGSPLPAFNGETQAQVLKGCRTAADWLPGKPLSFANISRGLMDRVPSACARAAVEMALLDAWARGRRLPLWVYFGGSSTQVATDITIPIMSPEAAAKASDRIRRFGVTALKIKVGRDIHEDAARVVAAMSRSPKATLIVDANSGYSASEAIKLLRLLKRRDIVPDLFEQPVDKDDWDGLRAVSRVIPVAADETVSSPADALRLARLKAAQYVNIKMMKCGVFGALETARTARAAGLGLMVGGMVESRLAMTCAAHLAAGLGDFRFIDLDTPLFFAFDPMQGPPIRRGGLYDLSAVRAGIGITPKKRPR